MKLAAAAVQMTSGLRDVAANRERADAHLAAARAAGAELVVLPEMFNTGYGVLPDYAELAEPRDGPTLRHLRSRSRAWGLTIAAGFVERDAGHLYDALALCTPDGAVHVYRKRHLVFWERFRFRPGDAPAIVRTPFGRVGLAVCADMIFRRVWEGYRGGIDLAIVAAAWPDFSNRHTGRRHWLTGHLGPMSAQIPARVATDLGVPVVFANQCGPCQTTIPMFGLWLPERLPDRFSGASSVCDGRHGAPVVAGADEQVVVAPITLHSSTRGPLSWRSTSPSGHAARSSASAA